MGVEADSERNARSLITAIFQCTNTIAEITKIDANANVRVLVTDDFTNALYAVEDEYGLSRDRLYSQTKSSVAAKGVTLYDESAMPLRATVIIDAECWNSDDNKSKVLQVYLPSHEMGHVLRKCISKHEGRRGEPPSNFDEAVNDLARCVREECFADEIASLICQVMLSSDDGRGIPPGEVFADAFLGSLCTMLELFQKDMAKLVSSYKQGCRDPSDIWEDIGPRTREILFVVAHLVGMCKPMGLMQQMNSAVSRLAGFDDVLRDSWTKIVDGLVSEDARAGKKMISEGYFIFLRNLGLRIQTLEGGGERVRFDRAKIEAQTLAENDSRGGRP